MSPIFKRFGNTIYIQKDHNIRLRIQIEQLYNGFFKIRIFLHIFPLMIESKITSRINDYCYYYVGQQYIEQCTLKV